MTYDETILEQKFQQAPAEVQNVLTSIHIVDIIKSIAQKYSLRIDQENALYDETTYVLLGLRKSKEFVKDFSSESGVTEEIARNVAADMNAQVLTNLHSTNEQNIERYAVDRKEAAVSAVEQAGSFTIERQPTEQPAPLEQTSAAPSAQSKNLLDEQPLESKTDLIAGLENPAPAQPRVSVEPTPQPAQAPEQQPEKKEPLVEQLLRGANAMPEQKVTRPAPQQPSAQAPQPPRPAGADPYREAIE